MLLVLAFEPEVARLEFVLFYGVVESFKVGNPAPASVVIVLWVAHRLAATSPEIVLSGADPRVRLQSPAVCLCLSMSWSHHNAVLGLLVALSLCCMHGYCQQWPCAMNKQSWPGPWYGLIRAKEWFSCSWHPDCM